MVQNRDTEGTTSLRKLPRDSAIFRRRGRIAGRMIVDQNDPRRTLTYRHAEDLARMNERRVENAPSYENLP